MSIKSCSASGVYYGLKGSISGGDDYSMSPQLQKQSVLKLAGRIIPEAKRSGTSLPDVMGLTTTRYSFVSTQCTLLVS
jgi:hypothetical protein